eukprot:gnl/Spiro4/11441_TR6043_c0_g1_i1.p1 gnl/Spiro4/11441_TR6043_c0_g1~~gnl/Spiro4/11441_TR6043_c0_g1_i1.p1  ORF type:complete len:219 (+),score=15.84 gnl/Spiro4/11441_TR6043_c0_g1_i1:154-810(+)
MEAAFGLGPQSPEAKLFDACKQGNLRDVVTLLTSPEPPDVNSKDDSPQREGFTALHHAVQNGHANVATYLLKKYADPNAVTKSGWSPLHLAAEHGFADCIQALCERGANLHAHDEFGYTPLHMAAAHGQQVSAELLLKHGAAVNCVDAYDRAPLDVTSRHPAVHDLLVEAGAVSGAPGSPDADKCVPVLKLGEQFSPIFVNARGPASEGHAACACLVL